MMDNHPWPTTSRHSIVYHNVMVDNTQNRNETPGARDAMIVLTNILNTLEYHLYI